MKRFLFAAAFLAAPSLAAQAPAARVYELSEVEAPPRPANVQELRVALDSTYPAEKRAAGVGARVQVAFVVGADGVPREVTVTQSTDAAFDAATVGGIGRLRFSPATVAGRPVAVRVEMPITWDAPAQASGAPVRSPAERDGDGERGSTMSAVTAEAETYELGEVDEAPRLLNPQALIRELGRRYPPEMRDGDTGGTIEVRFRVNSRGEVESPSIVRSSDPVFDEPTLLAVRVLRFRPARVGGRPVAAWVVQPIQWTVHGPDPREEDRRNGTDRPMFGRPRP